MLVSCEMNKRMFQGSPLYYKICRYELYSFIIILIFWVDWCQQFEFRIPFNIIKIVRLWRFISDISVGTQNFSSYIKGQPCNFLLKAAAPTASAPHS